MAPLSGYITRIWRRALRIVFGFDKWHVSSIDQRKYVQDIIQYCNKKGSRSSFVEIGCGLGDILLNVKFKTKKGFDADRKVLKAASFLARLKKQKVQFEVFTFPDSPLTSKYDVITMVNWIHHIEPAVLRNKIGEYFNDNLSDEGEILIDTVQDKEYKYNHNINFLIKELNCPVYRLGEYPRQREVWAIKKKK
jgi:2-polyprenyl-3-methyl-5-hydroxy-6-metoxy-1,4-benzoquinol methylase